MLTFKKPQNLFEIGNVKVGGQPGENPPVLIGSIFYHGHEILLNERKGKIDERSAEKLIKLQEEFACKTGIPCMLDVVGATQESMKELISFTADITEVPILIDSPHMEVKIAGLEYSREIGIERRVVYNSFALESKREEYEALKQSRVESAILLAYKGGFSAVPERVKTIEKLLPKAREAGVLKPLIDTCVMDLPTLSMACRAMLELKRKFGFPCGCGAHNAVSTWTGLKKIMGARAMIPCTVTVNVLPIVLGGDFILYGPVENCRYIFPSVYAINTSYKYLYRMKSQIEL